MLYPWEKLPGGLGSCWLLFLDAKCSTSCLVTCAEVSSVGGITSGDLADLNEAVSMFLAGFHGKVCGVVEQVNFVPQGLLLAELGHGSSHVIDAVIDCVDGGASSVQGLAEGSADTGHGMSPKVVGRKWPERP